MALGRTGVAVLAAALGGCALISGAADLSIDPGSDAGTTGPVDRLDGAVVDDRSISGSHDAANDAIVDGAGDAARDGPASPRIREVTFEKGLTGLTGADAIVGPVMLVSVQPIDGTRSMAAPPTSGYAVVTLPPLDEVFATFLVRPNNLGSSPTVFARFQLQGTPSTLDLVLTVGGDFQVKLGATLLATGGNLVEGAVHRIGVHLKRTAGQVPLVQVYDGPRGAAFGAAVANASSPGSVGPIIGVQIGAIAGGTANGTDLAYDDLLIDTASMPPP